MGPIYPRDGIFRNGAAVTRLSPLRDAARSKPFLGNREGALDEQITVGPIVGRAVILVAVAWKDAEEMGSPAKLCGHRIYFRGDEQTWLSGGSIYDEYEPVSDRASRANVIQ